MSDILLMLLLIFDIGCTISSACYTRFVVVLISVDRYCSLALTFLPTKSYSYERSTSYAAISSLNTHRPRTTNSIRYNLICIYMGYSLDAVIAYHHRFFFFKQKTAYEMPK